MPPDVVYYAAVLGIGALDYLVAYGLIIRDYKDAKVRGEVKSFGEFWDAGMKQFRDII
jgi:hypothetical protein